MKTTEQIIKLNLMIMFDDTQQGKINMSIKNQDEYWVLLKELKELIRRNKMDEDELKWNNTHPDWNKALVMIENAITSTSQYTDYNMEPNILNPIGRSCSNESKGVNENGFNKRRKGMY